MKEIRHLPDTKLFRELASAQKQVNKLTSIIIDGVPGLKWNINKLTYQRTITGTITSDGELKTNSVFDNVKDPQYPQYISNICYFISNYALKPDLCYIYVQVSKHKFMKFLGEKV